MVSRLFGAGDLKRMKSAVSTAFIACGVLSAVLTLFGWFFCSWMMELVHTPENIFSEGELYLKIYVYGLTFLFCTMYVRESLRHWEIPGRLCIF